TFPIDGFSKSCLLNGVDQLGFLLNLNSDTSIYEAEHAAPILTIA
ncbi:MAG: 3-isopropylmalate dehydratase small subunit, partial [Anaerolineae bacterium]|nr:3-isopropylmalate dehydratase small subunit [Anaerolineae bacterium]